MSGLSEELPPILWGHLGLKGPTFAGRKAPRAGLHGAEERGGAFPGRCCSRRQLRRGSSAFLGAEAVWTWPPRCPQHFPPSRASNQEAEGTGVLH